MNVVVFAKGLRALLCLEEMLREGIRPTAVLPQDGEAGVVAFCAREKIAVLGKPEEIFVMKPDLLVLAGYTRIIREPLISFPRLGTINLHGGRLPDYRGASVVNWQIINGEKTGGICVMHVDAGIDTGDVIFGETYPIGENDTFADVSGKILRLFPPLLVRALKALDEGCAPRVKQDLSRGRYYHKRRPEDGLLRWERFTAEGAHDFVRALSKPCPGAFTFFRGRKIYLWRARLPGSAYGGIPGRVVRNGPDGILVMASDGALLVTECEVEGVSDAKAFLKGIAGSDFKDEP